MTSFVCTLIIPFIAGIDFIDEKIIILSVLGLIAAFCTGLSEQKKYKELWISYRETLEQLKREQHLYDTKSDKYSDEPTKFNMFVENIETILSKEHFNWNTNIASKTNLKKQQ